MRINPLLALLLGTALVLALQGCVPMIAAGATTGALATFDRRTLGTQTEDETIEWKASSRVGEMPGESAGESSSTPATPSHLNFTSFNRQLLITGEVSSEDRRAAIEAVAAGVPQVQRVYNELTVGPVSSYTTRSNDAYITTRVKSRFVDAGKFNPVHVKVVTESGVVYLLGIVSRGEADAAIQIARTTSDVRKVVTLLEIVPEAQARELDVHLPAPRPPPADGISGG